MDLGKEISKLAEQFIDNEEVFLVEVIIKGKPGNMKIQVFIDGDQLVTVDECSTLSRKLSNELEERDLIDGRYVMEVSSPGVDRPLKMIRQFPKHIGRELSILTKENKKYQGELLHVFDDEIEISITSGKVRKELESKSLKLPISDIEKSTVVLRF